MAPSPLPPHHLTPTTSDPQTRIHDLETLVSALQADNRTFLTERDAQNDLILHLRTQRKALLETADKLAARRDGLLADKTTLENTNAWLVYDRGQLRTENWLNQAVTDRLQAENLALELENERLEGENARLGDVERMWLDREFRPGCCLLV
ncbi:hypothetical protein MMC26_003428 [Xylographa opegraphella]|nr:hypothetical protein [Xylographa opegraphella]